MSTGTRWSVAAAGTTAAASTTNGSEELPDKLPCENIFKLHSYCMSSTIVFHGYSQYISCVLIMVQYFVILFKLVKFGARIVISATIQPT